MSKSPAISASQPPLVDPELISRLDDPSSLSQNDVLAIRIALASHTHVSNPTNSPKDPPVSNPKHFTGKRGELENFLSQVRLVTSLQPRRFPTEQSKVLYTCSYLQDAAFTWIQPTLEKLGTDDEPFILSNLQAFFNSLRSTFGDPDRVRTAERDLRALRQSGSAATYAAQFRSLASRLHWGDEALLSQFRVGLSDDVLDALVAQDIPPGLDSYILYAIDVDNRLYERRQEKQNRRTKPSTNLPVRAQFTHRNLLPPPQTSSTHDDGGPAPMQVDSSRHLKFIPLSDKEKQRRRDQKLCLYCGQPNHVVNNCPLKTNRTKPINAAVHSSFQNKSENWKAHHQ